MTSNFSLFSLRSISAFLPFLSMTIEKRRKRLFLFFFQGEHSLIGCTCPSFIPLPPPTPISGQTLFYRAIQIVTMHSLRENWFQLNLQFSSAQESSKDRVKDIFQRLFLHGWLFPHSSNHSSFNYANAAWRSKRHCAICYMRLLCIRTPSTTHSDGNS